MKLKKMNYHSNEIESVLAALSKAQGSYKRLSAQGRTASGKAYATLTDILESIKESFEANGLSFFQYTELQGESGAKLLHSRIGHSSGQFLSSIDRVLPAQTLKESNTNLEIEKRTQAMMILGIAPLEFDPYSFDDDGELEAERAFVNRLVKDEPAKLNERYQTISTNDYNRLLIEIGNETEILRKILKEYHIESLSDLPADRYHHTISEIRRIKKIVEDKLTRG
jgi:hypothetical protein